MLTLFHTDGCHLCEQAWALVEEAGLATLFAKAARLALAG